MFRRELAALLNENPLTLPEALPLETFAASLAAAAQGGAAGDPLEALFYPLATHAVPACVTAQLRTFGARRNAESIYGPRTQFELPAHVVLPLQCEPEVFVTVNAEGDAAFAAELKRVPPGLLNEALTYALLGLVHSAFRAGAPAGRRYHTAPPLAFALLACGCVGSLVGVEWVGKLLVYPVSQPFFLGSPQHAAAVAALPTRRLCMEKAVVVPHAGGAWRAYPRIGEPQVMWTAQATPDFRFWKVIRCTAFDKHPQGGAARLRALHAAYARYSAACDEPPRHDPPPASLLRARLLYGAFELLVDMSFVGDREATAAELAAPGAVVDAVAAAVAWLARRGLLYVDLRAPNVRVGSAGAGSAWLVDYDDMVLLEEPARSAEDALRALCADECGARALAAAPALADSLLHAPWPGGGD